MTNYDTTIDIPLENGTLLRIEVHPDHTLLRYEKRDAAGRNLNCWLDLPAMQRLIIELAREMKRRDPGRHFVQATGHAVEAILS